MSKKLFDDLVAEVPVHHPHAADRVSSLISTLANRIADLDGDKVKASDLAATLRFDPDAMAEAILAAPAEAEPVGEAATSTSTDGKPVSGQVAG